MKQPVKKADKLTSEIFVFYVSSLHPPDSIFTHSFPGELFSQKDSLDKTRKCQISHSFALLTPITHHNIYTALGHSQLTEWRTVMI